MSTMKKQKIDRVKVYELLMYHDVVEIECGDVCISKEEQHKKSKESEQKAMVKLKKKLPDPLSQKFADLFIEFEEGRTVEARFAKAVDALDAEIHELDYKQDWVGWTEEFLRKKKQHKFKEFPELEAMFEKTIAFCRKNGYFEQ